MSNQLAWVDVERCTGCGVCVEACHVGAITLAGEPARARVDEEVCTGCGSCIEACPEDAVSHVIQGELVPAPEWPAPVAYRPSPLAKTVGAAIAVAGTGVLTRMVGALARAVERWLMRGPSPTGPSGRAVSRTGDGAGRGRRSRRRRRGR